MKAFSEILAEVDALLSGGECEFHLAHPGAAEERMRRFRGWPDELLADVLTSAAMGDRKLKLSDAEELGQAVFETKAVYRFKDPLTHTIVCACICWGERNASGMRVGQHQTLAERPDCGTLNGVSCEGGKLGDCEKKSVEVTAGREQVSGTDLVVMYEG